MIVGLDPSGRLKFFPVRIVNGASISDPMDLQGWTPKGFFIPGTIQGVTLTFLASNELNGQYNDVKDSGGTEVSITVASAQYTIALQALLIVLAGLRFVKVRTGTSASPQVQSAGREFFMAAGIVLT